MAQSSFGVEVPVLQKIPELSLPKATFKSNSLVYVPSKNFKAELTKKTKSQFVAKTKCPSQTLLFLWAERVSGPKANIKWETKDAYMAKNFTIERSLADSFHFVDVKYKAAQNGRATRKQYKLPDNNTFSETTYYRIRQFDTDGVTRYSNIVSLTGLQNISVRVFPNPATEQIILNVPGKISGKTTIQVHDLKGQLLQQQSIECTKGMLLRKQLSVMQLAKGEYVIKVQYADGAVATTRFIKS